MNLEYLQLEWLEPYQAARGRNRLPTKVLGEHESLYLCCLNRVSQSSLDCPQGPYVD